jgi:hypothetical protein
MSSEEFLWQKKEAQNLNRILVRVSPSAKEPESEVVSEECERVTSVIKVLKLI